MPDNTPQFFNTSETLLCIVSLEGEIRQVNPAWLGNLGYAPEELAGTSLLELVEPDELNLLQDHIEYLSTGGRTLTFPLRIRHRNGQYRQVLWHATLSSQDYSFYASGIDLGGVQTGTLGDIAPAQREHAEAEVRHAREQVQQALRAADARLRFTIEHLPIMVDALDSQGQVVLWNRECERVTGYSSEQMVGNPEALNLLYPDPKYRAQMLDAVRRVHQEDPGYRSGEWVVQCEDGSRRTIVWNVNSRLKIPGFAVWGVGVDVTERQLALQELQDNQQRLQQSETHLRYTLEHLPIMVDAVDENGTVLLWNRECERVSGYSAAEIVGKPEGLELLYPDAAYRAKMLKAVRQAIDTDPGFSYGEWMITCKNGVRKSIAWAINTKLKVPGFPVWAVGEDVTERNQALRQLRTNEYRFRSLVENMPVMLKAYDAAGNLVMWNRHCEKLTGYAAEEMVNNPDALGLLYPKPEHRLRRDVYFEQSSLTHWETEINCKDGRRRIIAWYDESRQFPISGWARWLVGEDVTDLRQACQAVDEDKRLFGDALDSLELGLCLTNSQEKIVYVNRALCALTGYSREELEQQRFATLLERESSSFVYRHYFSFSNGAHGDSYQENQTIKRRNGQLLDLRVSAKRLAQNADSVHVCWIFSPP